MEIPEPNFECTSPDQLGAVLGRWLREIDGSFLGAEGEGIVWGHVAALTLAMLALKRLPGFDCDMLALRDLQCRLEKLTVGQKQPVMELVQSVKPRGRAPASYFDHIREVRAVALVQAAVERGWTESEACELVASELSRAGVRGRQGKPISQRAVKAWCYKVKASDPAYKAASRNFRDLMHPDLSRSDMKKFARLFIGAGESLHR